MFSIQVLYVFWPKLKAWQVFNILNVHYAETAGLSLDGDSNKHFFLVSPWAN